MNESLKQRVIGGLVILALVVIFLPIVFNNERVEPLSTKTQVPAVEPRTIPEMNFPDIDTTSNFDQAKPVNEIFVPNEDEAVTVTKAFEESASIKGTSRDKDGVPIAWVLQIASFAEQSKADALQKKLKQDGYTVFTKTAIINNKPKTRVFVGPKLDKQRLFKERDKIEKDYNIKTLLIRSKP